MVFPSPLLLSLLSLSFFLPLLLLPSSSLVAGDFVTVDWSETVRVSRTYSTLQLVLNPLVTRASPVHDRVYQQLAAINTHYTRFQAWFPYPRYAVAELSPPSGLSQCSDVAAGYSAELSCAKKGGVIKEVQFAAFGTPNGVCNAYTSNPACDAVNATKLVEGLCVGQQTCSIPATTTVFGSPCPALNSSYRLAVQVTCDPPQNNTYWDFRLLDEMVLDFLAATGGRSSILDLSTQPNWLYWYGDRLPYHVSDNPFASHWDYTDQYILLDPTAELVGQYFGRVAAWYTQGGFYDEYNDWVESPHRLDIPMWEVLNEMEHGTGNELYTRIYDQTVKYIRQWADPEHRIQFVGLALEDPTDYGAYNYFLNSSNHLPDTPIDFMSYHRYALPSNRTNATTWEEIFTNFDEFFIIVQKVEAIRMALSPNTRTTIDEAGVILPGDNNTPPADPIPPLYWVAAASGFAYLFSHLSLLGVDVVGCSQLMGFPTLPDVLGGLGPQYSSVSMVNWTTGAGTARWQGLDLLVKELHPGDAMVSTSVEGDKAVWGQAYITQPGDVRKLLLVNTKNAVSSVTVEGAAGSVIAVIDEASGERPARREKVSSDTITFQPFAFGIVTWTSDNTPASPAQDVAQHRHLRGQGEE